MYRHPPATTPISAIRFTTYRCAATGLPRASAGITGRPVRDRDRGVAIAGVSGKAIELAGVVADRARLDDVAPLVAELVAAELEVEDLAPLVRHAVDGGVDRERDRDRREQRALSDRGLAGLDVDDLDPAAAGM